MIHQMFSIHDSKAAAYLPPFIIHRNEMAIRLFSDMVNNPDHQFSKNPADYTLFLIGEYNDEKGAVTEGLNLSLGNGLEFVRQIEIELEQDQQRLFTDPPIGNIGKTNNQDKT